MDNLIPRLSERRLTDLMRSFRVVVINGPRQAGKTTLLEMYRGREIDFLLERYDGRIVGIEAKATSSPSARDAIHLRWMREQLGDRFAAGIVIHLGDLNASFGDRVQVLPLSTLWGHKALA